MNRAKIPIVWLVITAILLAHLCFINFFYGDACVDRGGRFVSDKLMCEAESGFISFNVGPIFYVVSCFLFGALALALLAGVDRILKKRRAGAK